MNDSVIQILNKPFVIPTAVGVTALGVGFAGGYFYGKKKGVEQLVEAVYDEWVAPSYEEDTEIVEEREEFVEIQENTEETRQSFNEYKALAVDYSNISKEEVTNVEEVTKPIAVVSHNVFEGNSEDWDYDKEIEYRNSIEDGPYIIHVDEYLRNDLGYRQETLTYYILDDTLAGEDDRPVWNYRKLTGDLRFGHGSNDKNAVYIRNTATRYEWEILLHQGSFASEVEGYEIEGEYANLDLKHSNDRKFRQEV